MKQLTRSLPLLAAVLLLGLGVGLPQRHAQVAEPPAASDAAGADQTALDWALHGADERPVYEPVDATLLVCGDAMAHMPQLRDAKQPDGSYDFTHVFRDVAPVISAADYAVVNLETTLSGADYSGFPRFSSPDAFARGLRDAGFDLFLTANNHCFDRDFAGLSRTLDVLDELGVDHVGTYRTAEERSANNGVHLADVGGLQVAFVGYTYSTNGIPIPESQDFSVSRFNTDYLTTVTTPDTARIEADLAAARALEPDLICALMHWGVEYQTTQNAYQEQLADLLIANGADIILGGHSHVPQPMTWRTVTGPDGSERTGFVLYSLGNFISNQKDRYTDTTAAVQLTLHRDEQGETRVAAVAYQPIYRLLLEKGAPERYQLLDAPRALAAWEAGERRLTNAQADALRRCITDCADIFGAEWPNQIP